MKSLAIRKAKVNAVGVVGLVENMPGGNAQRPGDISCDGIIIINSFRISTCDHFFIIFKINCFIK